MTDKKDPQGEAGPPAAEPGAEPGKDPGKAPPPKAESKIRFNAHKGALMFRRLRNK